MLRRRRVACVNIGHPRKDAGGDAAMYHNLGSIGFVAAHRVVDVVLRDPEQPGGERRLLLRSANNLAPGNHGFAFKIAGVEVEIDDERYATARVDWMGRDDRDPDDVLRRERESKSETKAERAANLILRELAEEPRKARTITAKAEAMQISSGVLNAEKRRLGVKSEKRDPDGKPSAEFWWKLPPDEDEGLPF
jgi:hypothetical protein